MRGFELTDLLNKFLPKRVKSTSFLHPLCFQISLVFKPLSALASRSGLVVFQNDINHAAKPDQNHNADEDELDDVKNAHCFFSSLLAARTPR